MDYYQRLTVKSRVKHARGRRRGTEIEKKSDDVKKVTATAILKLKL